MGTGIAMKHAAFHGLINLAEGCVHAGLNACLGLIAGGRAVSITRTEAALHQRAHRRLVGLVLKAVALSDLDALL